MAEQGMIKLSESTWCLHTEIMEEVIMLSVHLQAIHLHF